MKRIALCVLVALLVGLFGVRDNPVQAQSVTTNSCPNIVRINGATSSAILIPHGGTIRICFYSLSIGLNATTTAQLAWGTGTICATNTVDASPLLQFGSAVTAGNIAITAGDGLGFIDENPVRNVSDFCIIVSGSGPRVYGIIRFGVY